MGIGQSSIKVLPSRSKTYHEIISSLKDDDISLIGVHGMAGVGKTTIVKDVYNRAVRKKLFDVIVWLVVSQDPDVKSRITRQISRALGLHDSSMKAGEIYERIVNSGKTVLIILDDVWHHLDLQSVGIPMTYGHRGDLCKFLVTSRNKETLRSMHSSMKLIPVTTLPADEASLLFHQLAGKRKSVSYSVLIRNMVKACDGLPLLIDGVARLLKGAPLSFWKYAFGQLRKSIFQFGDGMSFFVVKYSYDWLRDEEKFMFLLCSILGKQIYCQDLLKYGLGLGLSQEFDTVKGGRKWVYFATNSMKETYLLQDGETSQYATMHKIYHDLALEIASRNPNWFIARDGWPIKWPEDENEMEKVTYVSLLISNDTHAYPQGLAFPNLKFLHLHGENGSSNFADGFIEITNKERLKVLALIKMQLLPLPSSLRELSNMDTLCLDYCELGDISMIGELGSLRVLSLAHTNIQELPIEIGQLIRLCLLDLSNCSKLNVIPPGLLSSLTKLEELRMGNSFCRWDEGVNNASLVELRQLNSLSALDIHIPDAEIIPEGLPWDHLKRYSIIIGQDFASSSKHEALRDLKLNHNKGNLAGGSRDCIISLLGSCKQLWLKEVKGLGDDSVHPSFKKVTNAKIQGCPSLKRVFTISANQGVFPLGELEISGCCDMEAVANIDVKFVDGEACDFGFPRLHSLTLQDLDNLMGFFKRSESGSVSTETNLDSGSLFLNSAVADLPLLKHLKLKKLPKIRHLIPSSTTADGVIALQNLETMEIIECSDLSQLLVSEGDNHIPAERILSFRMLNQVTVRNCNKLKYLVPGNVLKNLTKLQNIDVSECAMLEQVIETADSNDKVLPPLPLRSLKLTNLPKLAGICSVGGHLTSMQLNGCERLKYVFPLSVAKELSSLQTLEIVSCARIGQIVTSETGETETTVEFPRLNTLILEKLSNFTKFCKDGCTVKWLTLNKVKVANCPKIDKYPLGQIDRPLLMKIKKLDDSVDVGSLFKPSDGLDSIAKLKIENSEDLSKYLKIIQLKNDPSFAKLKELEARQCDTKLTEFLSKLLQRSHMLEKLTVENCQLLEQVFDLGEDNKFPVLKMQMSLRDLPNLNCILNKDPSGLLKNLAKLEIINCGSLKNLLSTDFVENLKNLEELKIDSCTMIEAVVGEKETEEQQARSFPNLMKIELVSLPNFMKFNSGNCHFRFPKLQSLSIEHCPKMNAFTTGFFSPQAPATNATSSHTPDEMKDSPPKLKILKLVGLKTSDSEIWPGCVSAATFSELEKVEVDTLNNLKYIFPSMKLPKLESLVVRNCKSLNNVFQQTEEMDIELPELITLELSCLLKLKRVFGNDGVKLPLKLETLHIETCDDLEYLFLPSKCLNLKSVVFERLPSLANCFLELYEFQSLEQVRIVDCPKIKQEPAAYNLFNNIGSFAELKELHLKEVDDCQYIWKNNDLDGSTRDANKGLLPGLEKAVLIGLPQMELLWEHKPRIAVFTSLTSLEIIRCQKIKTLFSISVAKNLNALEMLKLYACENMEQVLEAQRESSQVFKSLKFLVLKHLSSLTSFCEREFAWEFPQLRRVRVKDIPKMKTFVRGSVTAPKLNEVYVTFVKKCWQGDLNKTIEYLNQRQVS